ncbi:MAG: hypothetical protein K0A94_10380 [Desulfuromonadales bacterium]|nr:hypothetical protein [Desulfuromonadales bacterium]
MGQVTIYLDDEIEAKMRAAAQSENLSQSKWVAQLIKEKTLDRWPQSVVRLAGTWDDMPMAEEIRSSSGVDTIREKL